MKTLPKPPAVPKSQTAPTTKEPAIEVEEQTPETPEVTEPPKEPECNVTMLLFLMSALEAKAIVKARPDIIPPGFKGKTKAVRIRPGFNRAVCNGARVVSFTPPCNIAAAADSAAEVPCGMTAWERNQALGNAQTEEAKEELFNNLVAAMKKQEQIPIRVFECKEISTSQDAEVIDF